MNDSNNDSNDTKARLKTMTTTTTNNETKTQQRAVCPACASSAMGALKGQATVQRELVTCEKCKRLLEQHDARRAAAATK